MRVTAATNAYSSSVSIIRAVANVIGSENHQYSSYLGTCKLANIHKNDNRNIVVQCNAIKLFLVMQKQY